jgi:hypothetical protein
MGGASHWEVAPIFPPGFPPRPNSTTGVRRSQSSIEPRHAVRGVRQPRRDGVGSTVRRCLLSHLPVFTTVERRLPAEKPWGNPPLLGAF